MVEPLILTVQSQTIELATLAAAALVNLCSHSDDIRECFYQRKGHEILIKTIEHSRDDELILNLLKLCMSVAGESDKFHRMLIETDNFRLPKLLL